MHAPQGSSRRGFFLSALALGAAAPTLAQTAAPNIDAFFTSFTDEWMRNNPSRATSMRYFKGSEQDQLARQLTPMTLEHRKQTIALARRGLSQLKQFDRARMTDVQRISAELLEWQLQILVDGEPFMDYGYPLQQMSGANVNLIEGMTVGYPIANERDAENYVAALGQAGVRLDEATAEAKRLQGKNVVPPRFILSATVKQMQGFVDGSPAQNPFVTTFDDKMKSAKVPAATQEQLSKQAQQIVANQLYPAWKRGIAMLEAQTAAATDDAGLWRLKGGDEAYRYYLRLYTTTNDTPEQIHQIGLDRVAALEKQMDVLFRKLGRADGSVKQRIEQLKEEMRYPDPASEQSRAQIMTDIDGIIRDAERRAVALFDIRPKSPVVAKPFPAFRENNAAANYNPPAPDGSRPGIFQYPRRVERMTKFGLRSTVYHETVPGHHFQIALQVENKDLPRWRQNSAFGIISALAEGWGLYAEKLAAESGWYGDDVRGQLGQLDAELFRARRLVVDTGLHAKHWTRQQGIDYGIERSEVERYTVMPGQACSYMIGQLKIIELREKAKQTLGGKFSLEKFHDKVLTTGTVPLELLQKQVDSWVRTQA